MVADMHNLGGDALERRRQLFVRRIGVGLELSRKATEIFLRPRAFAIGRVAIIRRWRSQSVPRRFIDRIDP